jgi:general L-amino acid transport system substrate-binding protein
MKKLFSMAAATIFVAGNAYAGTLDDVKAKGYLDCGVSTGVVGFAAPDDKGEWAGFDVDVCRAVAVAIFGDKTKVKFTPTTGKSRFPTLASGEIDMLARNTTWTFSRDVQLGFEFAGVNYYDGQGFMVRKDLGVKSAKELNGASVCIQTGTTTELNLSDYFKANGMKFEPIAIETNAEARPSYEQGRCDVYTTDASGLASTRAQMSDPKAHIILPEIISKEPLGPLVRHGDNQWGDVVRWTLNAMIIAEELGVTSANVDEMKNSPNAEIQRLLGVSGEYGEMMGLSKDWAYNIIKAVGNYGESFERNVGVNTPLGLERGLNQLWNKGGILYAPPFR